MKKLNYFLPVILLGLLLLGACEKDYLKPKEVETVEITTAVSFSHDVVPILVEDCAKSSCHVAHAQAPDLTAANAYNELTGLGYVDTSNAEGSVLYTLITSTSDSRMPPSGNGTLTAQEIGYILAWIKQGAQNN